VQQWLERCADQPLRSASGIFSTKIGIQNLKKIVEIILGYSRNVFLIFTQTWSEHALLQKTERVYHRYDFI
jgi:hypothetical protein